MSGLKLVIAALFLLLSNCMTPAPIQPPSTFYVMRHLNTQAGISDPNLTPEGLRQAERLATWFQEEPPVTIFVSDTRRARQTAAPLATRLGIVPRIYDPSDTAGLVAEVMKEPAPVLIVGHSNTVAPIIKLLGGTGPAPILDNEFGDIWRISGTERKVTRLHLGGE